jgi:hypothetical protein
LGSADMGVVSPGKLDYVSLTSRDWAMHHWFLPHVGRKSPWPWTVRPGLSFSNDYVGCGQARLCCSDWQAILFSHQVS